MRPIHFPQQQCILGRDQVEVSALPAFRGAIPYRQYAHDTEEIISCYRLTDLELEALCKNRVLWVRQIVAVRGPMQPQMIQVENPFLTANGTMWDGKGLAEENWKKV